jgi:FkbM family methyltransferase
MQLFSHNELPSLLERQRAAYTRLTGGKDKPIVLFGAGDLGQRVLKALRACGMDADCFCDNDVKLHGGKHVLGCPVLPVSVAASMLRDDAVFVVCVYNGSECREQLLQKRCGCVVGAAVLVRHLGPPATPLLSIDLATVLDEQREDVLRCGELWADSKSEENYNNLVNLFSTAGDCHLYSSHDDPSDTYYPPGLWKELPQEHVVDCGAYDGDGVQFFADRFGDQLASLTAFEPDERNFNDMVARVAAMPPSVRSKTSLVLSAVGAASGVLRFDASGTVGASVVKEGGVAVVCSALDDTKDGRKATYVKMDLEGYEVEALRGAASVLRDQQPVLAVTTYHRMEHLWQVPLLIHALNPDYKLYLRRYAEDCWESVCYAVPTERTIL